MLSGESTPLLKVKNSTIIVLFVGCWSIIS
jgi:hypothetical protein